MRHLDASRRARSAGDLEIAIVHASTAAELVRGLRDDHPDDPRQVQMLGGMLYNHAALLNDAGRHGDAVLALDESEEVYSGLKGEALPVPAWIADVRARRAFTQAIRGAGASALADAQSAVLGHRALDGVDDLDRARVLALGSDVLGAFGDPDLAVAAADHAVQIYLGHPAPGAPSAGLPVGLAGRHVAYLARAARVASLIRAARHPDSPAHGVRLDRTLRADRPDRPDPLEPFGPVPRLGGATDGNDDKNRQNAGNRAGPRIQTVLERRLRSSCPPVLTSSLAGALRSARARGNSGGDSVDRLYEIFARRPASRAPLVSLDRVPATATADSPPAFSYAVGLADLAAALTPADPVSAFRLGLEAHCIFAGSSPDSDPGRDGHAGEVWAETLLSCSRHTAAGDATFAADLASWAVRVRSRRRDPTAGDAAKAQPAVR
jgi:hypothetical protein